MPVSAHPVYAHALTLRHTCVHPLAHTCTHHMCTYMHIYAHSRSCTPMHTCVHAHPLAHTLVCICTHAHPNIATHMHIFTHTHIYTHTHTSIYTHAHAPLHTPTSYTTLQPLCLHGCSCVCTSAVHHTHSAAGVHVGHPKHEDRVGPTPGVLLPACALASALWPLLWPRATKGYPSPVLLSPPCPRSIPGTRCAHRGELWEKTPKIQNSWVAAGMGPAIWEKE